jgi:transcriptional regulator with XRE-family HTH domain
MNIQVIGKRLAQLRNELGTGPGEAGWSQARLAETTGLTVNQVARMEQTGGASIEAFVTMLTFYHQRGYSISWILLPDNSSVSKVMLGEAVKAIDSNLVSIQLEEFKQKLVKQVDSLAETLNA